MFPPGIQNSVLTESQSARRMFITRQGDHWQGRGRRLNIYPDVSLTLTTTSNYQTFHNLGVLTVNVTLLLTIALSLKNPRTSQKAFIKTESSSSSCSSSVLCFCWNDAVCWQNDCFSWYFLRANYVSDYLGRYLGDWDEIFPAKSARSCPETVGQRRVYTGRYSEADKERYLAQNKQNKILPLTVNDIYINQVLLTTFQQVETSTLSSLRSSNFNCFDKIFVFES